MPGNDDTKNPQEPEGANTEGGAEPQPRPPRDSSGELIAVEVEPAVEEGAGDGETAAEPQDMEAALREQLDKKQNQLLRVAADFDNYKKRSRRDVQEATLRARNELLQDLLPVIDNVELALAHTTDGNAEVDAKALREGVNMVLRQFTSVMEKYEVHAFDSLGKPFDPNFHEALQQRQTDEHPPGVVVEEFRRGYLMGERLIRPAMVVVAAAPAPSEPQGAADDATSGEDG